MVKTIIFGELNYRGQLSDQTVELLNFISEIYKNRKLSVDILIASQCNTDLINLSLPEFVNNSYIIKCKADNKKYFQRCANALMTLSNDSKAQWLFFPSTIDSVQIALIYATKNESYLINGITDWESSEDSSCLVFKKSILNKINDTSYRISTNENFVGIISKNIFKDMLIKRKADYVLNDIPEAEPECEYTVSETIAPSFDKIDISESEIVVGAGRGIEKKEYFDLIPELARVLNAGYGGTRVAVDFKWLGHERQIGRTGKNIKPYLYIAIGISGSTHHTFGIKSKYILSINTDKNAPIFSMSDIKVCSDAKTLLPVLIKKIKTVKVEGEKHKL